MKRQRPSELVGAAVIFMAVVLAVGTVSAHEAKTKKRFAAQPVAGQVEQSVPFKSMDPAVMMPGAHMGRLMMPRMDPRRGKELFITKGCVACHAINGIGGHDAPNLDAHTMTPMMNPFEFAAKMWNHAPAMIAAQEAALGEQIMFTGQELADIIAFVHHDQVQHGFMERDMTPEARKMMDHDHGDKPAHMRHSEELGHKHHMGGQGKTQ